MSAAIPLILAAVAVLFGLVMLVALALVLIMTWRK